jgi:hypothetical protein
VLRVFIVARIRIRDGVMGLTPPWERRRSERQPFCLSERDPECRATVPVSGAVKSFGIGAFAQGQPRSAFHVGQSRVAIGLKHFPESLM